MVAEEPTVWRSATCRRGAIGCSSQASDAVERARARLLLGKVARFEDIKQRYDHINAMHEEIERADHQLAGTGPRPRGIAPQFDTEGRYDGVGKLTRVTSPQNGGPQYALLDRERPRPLLRYARTGHQPALLSRPARWASTAPAATCPSSRPATSWPSTST